MIPPKILHSFLLAAGSSLLVISSASAQLTWDGNSTTAPNPNGGAGTWNTTTTNWWNGTTNVTWPSSGTNNDAVFANTAGTVSIAVGGVTANDLTFNTTGYIIQSNTLTLNGTTPTITMGSNIAATISSQILGSAGLTKSGVGSLTLSGNNNYSGITTVNNGTVTLGNANALGATGVGNGTVINGNTGSDAFFGTTLNLGATALTLSEAFSLNANTTGRATIFNNTGVAHVLNGSIDVTSNTNNAQIRSDIVAGSITVNGDISGTMTSGAFLFIRGDSTSTSNRILGSLNIGSSSLTKGGTGTWTIGATGKTYAWGATDLVQGTLRMEFANVMPSATVVTFGQASNTTATLDLNGTSQTVAGIQLAAGSSGTKTITSSTAATLTVGSASNFTYGGVLAGSLAITKTGAGTQTLSGLNTYTAATAISAGTLSAGNIVVSGGSSNLGNATSAVTLGSAGAQGTLSYTGNTATYTRGFIIGGAGGGRLDVTTSGQTLTVGTGNVTGSGLFTVGGAGNSTISSSLTHTGGLTKQGASTLTLSGSGNTFNGNTTISGGSLALSGSGSIANSPVIQINSSTSLNVTGVTGSSFTIGSTQTVGGTGSIVATGKTIVANGTLSPGNSPGAMIVDGGVLQLGVGGDTNMQVFDASGLAGVGYDTVTLINGGSLDLSLLSAGNTYNINLWSLSAIGPNVSGFATNFNNTQNYSWTLFDTGAAISGFSTDKFTLNLGAFNGTDGFTNALGGGTFSVGLADGNTNLVVNFTVIPEPSVALLGGFGILALLRRRR